MSDISNLVSESAKDNRRAAHRKWMRENSKTVPVTLFHKSDGDLIAFLNACGVPKATMFKTALRDYIERNGGIQ